jgi:hypothetical protein
MDVTRLRARSLQRDAAAPHPDPVDRHASPEECKLRFLECKPAPRDASLIRSGQDFIRCGQDVSRRIAIVTGCAESLHCSRASFVRSGQGFVRATQT